MKFHVLQRHFDVSDPNKQFELFTVTGKTRDAAWDKVDNEIADNTSQEWLMTNDELFALKQLLTIKGK